MKAEKIIAKAAFNPKVANYWLVSHGLGFVCSIVLIPFIVIYIPIALYLSKRILECIECTLTETALKVKKGIFVKTENTIPLEKITDIGMVEGPLMRRFGVQRISVETAGQTSAGPLAVLTGIVDAAQFRERVLAQRDNNSITTLDAPNSNHETTESILADIRDSLKRIESVISDKN